MSGRNIRRVRPMPAEETAGAKKYQSGAASSETGGDLITSIAKGLAQAQSGTNSQTIQGQEIMTLLTKISDQLTQLQGQASSGTGETSSQSSMENQSGQNSDPLRQLFSQLLQTSQQQNNQSGGNQSGKERPVLVKTAAQVLSEAQYELSVELENSLQKLKQVIRESEKLADKISNLLGEEKNAPKS